MAKTQKPAPKGGKKIAAPKKLAKAAPKKGRASNVSTKINRTNQPMPPLADAKQHARVIAEDERARLFAQLEASVEASKNFSANVSQLAAACFEAEALALPAPPPPSPKSKWWRQYQGTETGKFIGWRKVLTKTKNQVISRLRLRKPAR